MKIEIRLFARLREKLPPGSPRGRCQLEIAEAVTITDVLARLGIPRAGARIVLVNGEQTRDFDRALRDGDVLSVFPPLAGGGGLPVSVSRREAPAGPA